MHIIVQFCFFVLLPYRVSTDVVPMQGITGELQKMAGEQQKMVETSNNIPGVPDVPDVAGMSGSPDVPDLVSVFWFDQKLDHFLSTDVRKWKQMYYANYNYYNENGPVFLMVGGLVEINESDIRHGAWIEYAETIGATIYYLEHRFYGQSHPSTELNDADLVYLNSEQALADLALFIVTMRRNIQNYIPLTTKWIAFGVSYGGTLAARLRLKYPHLIHAVVTSSSPFSEIVNFGEYFEVIAKEFDKYPGVKNAIQGAYKLISKAIENRSVELEKNLCLCTHLRIHGKEKKKNKSYLFWNLSYNLGYIMQNGKLKEDVMRAMVDESKLNALDRLASAIEKILEYNGAKCLSVDYEEALREYKTTSWNAQKSGNYGLSGGLGNRQKLYQRCTEFGQFETSDQKNGLFGHYFPLEFYIGICTEVFGKEFNLQRLENGVARTKLFYGGLGIEVSRVLFVNDGQDPVNIIGVTKSKPNDQIAVYLQIMHFIMTMLDMHSEARETQPRYTCNKLLQP